MHSRAGLYLRQRNAAGSVSGAELPELGNQQRELGISLSLLQAHAEIVAVEKSAQALAVESAIASELSARVIQGISRCAVSDDASRSDQSASVGDQFNGHDLLAA